MTTFPPSLGDATGDDRFTRWVVYVAEEASRQLNDTTTGQAVFSAAEYRQRAVSVVRTVLEQAAANAVSRGNAVLDPESESEIARRAVARVCGLGPLEDLLIEPDVENINLTGTRVWVRHTDGSREERPPVVDSEEELAALVRRLAADSPAGERRFDPAAPILNLPLTDGSRLHAVMDVSHAVAVSIRRHHHRNTSLSELRRMGTLDDALVGLLRAAVRARCNIVITGATGAGKTTLLRALASEIPALERVITIEDTPELGLEHDGEAHPDCVALHARPPNVEGQGEVRMSELVRAALRMSPDRVLVGETLGEETLPLLKAMTQGNKGSLTTLHADSSADAFARFCAYAVDAPHPVSREEVAMLFGPAVDLVVHLSSSPRGERVVTSVREIVGTDGTQVSSNEIYRRGRDGHLLQASPPSPDTVETLAESGFDTTRMLQNAEVAGWVP